MRRIPMRKNWLIVFWFIALPVLAQNSIVQQFSNVFTQVVEKVNPTVVTVLTDKTVKINDLHDQFPFGDFFPRGFGEQEFHSQALGSGVIVDAERGYILTNNHVVQDMDKITVKLIDKREYKAKIVGTDPQSDIAVLQIEAEDLTALPVGDSDQLKVGEWVLAIGSPFSPNLSHSVTAGIVSALGRSNIISGNNYEDFIQTDAAINPGNSGGALVNMKGELVGINTAIATGGFERSNRGVGFAIPSNMARKVMEDLITKGYVVRAWLGVYIQEIEDSYARALDLETRNGALVSDVVDDSPAEKAGLKAGDVITAFDHRKVKGPAQLKNIVSSSEPGKRYAITIIRNGKEKTFKVRLEELPENPQMAATKTRDESGLGLKVRNMNRSLAEKFNLDPSQKGVVVVAVDRNSEAYRAGIRPGDVITKVGTEDIEDVDDFETLVKTVSKENTILLLVKRDKFSRFYALDLSD